MAGGTEVARLAVRVVPNTKNFRQATAASIKRQMKGFKVKVPVSPDTKGFAAEVKAKAKTAAAAASGNNVNFDTDLDTAGLGAKARAAAKAASGNKITFRVLAGSAFDRIGRQFARINEGLLRLRRNTRQVSVLSRTFKLFGRSVRKATNPVRTLGKALLSIPGRSELLRAYADDLNSYVFKPSMKRADALQKKLSRPLRLRFDKGAAINDMAQIRRMVGIEASRIQALQRSKGAPTGALRSELKQLQKAVDNIDWDGDWAKQVRALQSDMGNLRRRIKDNTDEAGKFDRNLNQAMSRLQDGDMGRIARGFREIQFQTRQIGDNLRHSRLGDSLAKDLQVAQVHAERLRNSARGIKREFVSTPLGFQMEQGFRRAQGSATALRERVRQIGRLSSRISFGGGRGRGNLLGRGVTMMRGEIDKSNKSMGRFLSKIPRIGTAFQRAGKKANGFFKNFRQKYFQPDSTIGFIVAAIMAAIAPVAGLVGSLMAGLPTLLAAVGAAALVVALGFDGIKAAAQPLISALAPLKESLSGIFEENLTPQFEKLAGVLPLVTPALEQIATGLTVMSGAFVDAFSSTDNVEKFNSFLGQTADLFAGMAPGVASFTDGFLTMFEGAARGFPAMAAVFNGFSDLFSKDMSRLVDTGQMQAAMESLAVATGSLLVGLHNIFVAGIEQMPRMSEGFVTLFDGISDGMVTAMPALAAFSNGVGKALGGLIEGLGEGIATLGTHLSESLLGSGISEAFAAMAPAISTAYTAITSVVGLIGNELGAALHTVAPALGMFASAIADRLNSALGIIAPHIPTIANAIAQLASVFLLAAAAILDAFGPILDIAISVLASLIGIVASIIGAIAGLANKAPGAFSTLVVGAVAAVVAFRLVAATATIVAIATTVMATVMRTVATVIAAVKAAFWLLNAAMYANPIGIVVALIVGLIAALAYFFTQTELGRAAWQRLTEVFSGAFGIISAIGDGIGKVASALGLGNDAADAASDSMTKLSGQSTVASDSLSGVTGSAIDTTSAIGGIPGATDMAIPGLGNLGAALEGATGSANGLAGAIPGVDTALSQAGTTAETMSWHVSGIGDAAMGAVPVVQESTQLFNDAFLNMLPGMAEAERRTHEMGVNMGTNIAGVANSMPGAMAPFHEELFNIPLNANTAMNDTTAILGAGLAGFAATNPDFVGPIKMQFDEIPKAADTAMSNTQTAVSTGIGDVASSVQTGLAPVPGHVTEAGTQMTTEMTTAMTNMNTGIQTGVDNAGQIASTLVPTVKGAIGDTNALHSSGLALGNSFAAGIRASIPAAAAAAAELAGAVKANMPNSPAKEGPLSGKGYTDESGKALARDFAGGIRSEVGTVSDAARDIAAAAKEGVEQYQKSIDQFHDDNLTKPIMEGNARRIADFRKREAEALEKGNADMEKLAEDRQKMLESLEVPDFREINRSIQAYYIDGTKGLFNQAILKGAADNRFSDQLKQVSLQAVKDAREHFGDHPVMAQIEANVNAEHFAWSVEEAIKAADLGAVPIDLAISNLDQLKNDLGFGDGALTRGIQAVLDFNPNDSDAYRYEKQKEEVHYHVRDLEEAMRLEDERRRRGALRYV